ncbi:MAG: heavy-metal-associated domain-containing protein [Candidatus Methanomethylophilus sp.]|jgi:copper chaperone CopZ|nr:heavy-metal-associated domain-containing protein [Methanomethylophilus sp.]MCI2075244.1 heavy-metal-associated domain-containing protein [Methanomethylophilus sp.]MCI2092586.1 heavy-metal-associated domain-containing protein [Methanomethylophilus sp.]MEE3400725.1 heavy-metal-associated domain-containing protein [Methanomethylophilus sp.]WII09947.1 heavy-metal-associated domain-containing protein [Methanomassiliicoccales archaeon LGM-DZ1]
MAKLSLKIENMMCENCVANVTKALESVSGVSGVKVKIGSAKLEYDESKTDEAAIVKAVVDAGYPAKVKKGLF